MRVAVVVSTFPPYPGGMGNAAAAHAEALEAAGHDVTVFSPGRNLRPLFRVGNSACAPQLWWRLRGFDAVELHYPFFGGAEWVWLWKIAFGRRARLAVMYHMDAIGSGLFALIFRLYRALFLKRVLAAADVILASSREYLAASQAASVASDPRVSVTPFGVDAARFRPRDGFGPRNRSAIFVGGLDRAHAFKGMTVLLEALAYARKTAPEASLVVVGDGNLRREYERQAAALGLAGRVRFLGRVPDADLPEAYRSAAFHVLPSVDASEAFGIVTVEAAMSGIPSVVSDLPGVRASVEEGVTGFRVPPRDPFALGQAMATLFKDAALCEAMGKAARRRAELRYARGVVDRAVVEAVVGRASSRAGNRS